MISDLFVNEKESWNSYCELAVDSYGHELVSGNWSLTAMVMDRCLETGQWQLWIGVWKLDVNSYGYVSGNWLLTAMAMGWCLETCRWQLWSWIDVLKLDGTVIAMYWCLETDLWQLWPWICVWKLVSDSYGNVSGNWPMTAMVIDCCLETCWKQLSTWMYLETDRHHLWPWIVV